MAHKGSFISTKESLFPSIRMIPIGLLMIRTKASTVSKITLLLQKWN